MKYRDTRIKSGGMMRCCIESLSLAKKLEDECLEGEIVTCRYGSSPAHSRWILRAGIWAWDRPASLGQLV
jgi:hypothetical protein